MEKLAFKLGEAVVISVSGESGSIIGCHMRINAEPQYLIRYAAADGRAVEIWWDQDALHSVVS